MPVKKEIRKKLPQITKIGIDYGIQEYRNKYKFLGVLKVSLPIEKEKELVYLQGFYPLNKVVFDIDFLEGGEVLIEELK